MSFRLKRKQTLSVSQFYSLLLGLFICWSVNGSCPLLSESWSSFAITISFFSSHHWIWTENPISVHLILLLLFLLFLTLPLTNLIIPLTLHNVTIVNIWLSFYRRLFPSSNTHHQPKLVCPSLYLSRRILFLKYVSVFFWTYSLIIICISNHILFAILHFSSAHSLNVISLKDAVFVWLWKSYFNHRPNQIASPSKSPIFALPFYIHTFCESTLKVFGSLPNSFGVFIEVTASFRLISSLCSVHNQPFHSAHLAHHLYLWCSGVDCHHLHHHHLFSLI